METRGIRRIIRGMRAAAAVLVALLCDATPRGVDVDLSRLDLARTHEGLVVSTLSPSGLHGASYAGNTATITDLRTGTAVLVLKGHDGNIHDSGWARDGRSFATTGFDGMVRSWEISTGRCTAAVAAHPAYACSVALSPDGRRFATGGSADPHVKIYESAGGRELRSIATPGGATYSLAFSGDGRFLVGNQADGHLRVWRTQDGAPVLDLTPRGAYVTSYAFSRDGRLVAFPAAAGAVHVVGLSDWTANGPGGARVRVLEGHPGGSSFAAFHPSGRHLATSGADGEIRIWDVATGKAVNTLQPSGGKGARLAFTPDGRSLVVVGSDKIVRIYEARR
jgi:WD40 repeat protein